MSDIVKNLDQVRADIADAARKCGREPSSITLVAVSKTHSPERVRIAYEAGQRVFGENYAQEFAEKFDALIAHCPNAQWHFIGHLQRNKAKLVAPRAHAVETVDSVELAQALIARLPAGRVLDVFVQVNVAGELQKSGCAPGEVAALVDAVRALPGVNVRGLMTVPPIVEDPESSRPHFVALRALAQQVGVRELSMGMSHDFRVAIEEGATSVRVGTAIFGKR